MRKIKLFFSFITILIIIYFILIYLLLKNIDLDDIISNIDGDINIIIEKNLLFKILPVVEIQTDISKIEDVNLIANDISLILSQPHFIRSGSLNLKINELFINKLVLDNIIIQGRVKFIENYLKHSGNILNIFNGKYEINGKLSLKTTNEEGLIISFLKLFFEELEKERNDKFALSSLIDSLSNSKSYLNGSILKENNILQTNKIVAKNNSNKIILSGTYNLITEEINFDVDLEQKEEIFISAIIQGTIKSPKIVMKNSEFFNGLNRDNNTMIEEVIIDLLDKFLMTND